MLLPELVPVGDTHTFPLVLNGVLGPANGVFPAGTGEMLPGCMATSSA